MHFDWSPIPPPEWRDLLACAPRANLLQSWPYAVAARLHDQMMSRRALIVEGGVTVGLMQIQEVKLGPVHVLKLHRGPLWFDAEADMARWQRFFAAFNREFPRRFGRWRQVLPELDDDEEARSLLEKAGLRRKGPEPYRTIMLNLQPSLDAIRKRLKSNWRNKLNQSEKSGLTISCDPLGLTAKTFLAGYAADKSARGYRGPAPERLATLIAAAVPAQDALILNAAANDKTVAAVLMFRHGHGATYQAGWTTEEGRKRRAHHLLLWNAIARLKEMGIAALDLGGIHPRMAEGVTTFKEGLGGAPVTLVGLYG